MNRRHMSEQEFAERDRLRTLWATGRATKAQMLRCMELDRRAEADAEFQRKHPAFDAYGEHKDRP